MKMMQPLDLRVRQYGAVVWRSIAYHCLNRHQSMEKGEGRCAHIGPRNLADIEEFVIAACDDPILHIGTFCIVGIFSCEETPSKGGKRAGDIIIFELVHFPAGDLDRLISGRFIGRSLDEFRVPRRELVQSFCKG